MQKKKKSIFRKIGKFFAGIIIFLIILIIGLYFFIQTDTFNKWALDYTLNKLNKSWELKDNKVNAESLNGNILKGIALVNGNITVKGDTLVKFASLEVKYDLWALLKHKINLDYVILNSPRINFLGSKDSVQNIIWNYANLFSSTENEDTSKSVFDWDVTIDKFKIENGFLRVIGDYQKNTDLWKPEREKIKEFDFANLDLSDLQLELNAKYFKDSKSINIVNLSFNTNSDFNLKKLALESNINIKDSVTDIRNLELLTNRSDVKINKLRMNGFNPFNGVVYENFKDKNVDIKIDIKKFNFDDLTFFLPELDFMDSTVAMTLDANGNYGNLNINNLTVNLPNSSISFKGNVQNLHDPSNLYFDVRANNLNLQPRDTKIVLPGIPIPDYSNLGPVQGNIYYKGTVDNFYSEYNLTTGGGNVNGQTSLNLQNESYNGYLVASGINLGKILKDNKLNSNLNITAKFDGSGFALNKMSSNIIYSLNNSSMAGYSISSSNGNIKAMRNNFTFNIKANSSAGNTVVAGRVNISNMKNPVYVLKGNVSNLDVSKFTKNSNDKSSINTAFDINGRGADLNNINGQYNFVISRSSYGEYRIAQTPLNIQINNSGNESSLKVVTDMAEINANGTFNIASLTNAVTNNIKLFSESIQNKLIPGTNSNNNSAPVHNSGGNAKLSYEVIVKDTAKLSEILRPFGIVFKGNIKGSIDNSASEFRSAVLLDVKDFKYKDTSIVLKNVKTDLIFKNDYSANTGSSLSPFTIALNTTGDRIIFGANKIDSARVNINMINSVAEIKAKAKQDSVNYGNLSGRFDLSGDKITAEVDSIFTKYGKYEVSNSNKWIVSYTPGREVNFEQFALKSKKIIINVNGTYSITGSSDVRIEGDNIPLANIFDALNPPDTAIVLEKYKYPVEGELTTLSVEYKGTIDNPELNAILSSNVLEYDGNKIGTVSAKFVYKDEVLTPDIEMKNYGNKGNLVINGNIPFKNPLIPQDSSVEFTNNPVDLKLTAKDFQLAYFTKLFPGIGNIEGILKGELTAKGTASNPELAGNLSINKGSYFLSLTGMDYKFNLNVSTANSKLVIDKLSLMNVNEDTRHFDIFGNIDFKGLKLNEIDLQATGDMVFLDKDVDANDLGVYGYLYAGSGSPPITIKGNFKKLDIKGQFLIKDATISSVPLQGSGYDMGSDNFTYVNASDLTTWRKEDSLIIVSPEEMKKISPFERYKYALSENESSVMDFLNLDVNVKTEKNIYASIDFNNITRDRLFGEIQADINFKTLNKELNAEGSVNVVGDSYYRFYRDFKVKDSRLTFNGPISNPVLDIKAVYEGTKPTQQFGATSSIPVQVQLTIKGEVSAPLIELKLLESGSEVSGSDAQADAITFLLFGKYKSELSTSQRQAVATSVGSSVGSLYASSFISQAIREVLPFIVDAEFNYKGGDVQNTDVSVTSQFGEATVKVGSREVQDANYFEFTVDYPVNKLLNLSLPETLLLEIAKEELTNSVISSSDVHYSMGLKLIYKIKF